MDITGIRTQIGTVAAGVSGVRGASAQNLDAIPGTPYFIVGNPVGELTPGNRQLVKLDFPILLLTDRASSPERTEQELDNLFNATLVAFAAKMTLAGTVTEAYISRFDFNRAVDIAGESYLAIEFTVHVVSSETATYLP